MIILKHDVIDGDDDDNIAVINYDDTNNDIINYVDD